MLEDRPFKSAVYEQWARLGQALAHPRRVELLDLLCQGPMTVETLARRAELSVGSTSQHLARLRAARLVETERAGTPVRYRLAEPGMLNLLLSLRDLARRRYAEVDAAVAAFLDGRPVGEPVDPAGLEARLAAGDAILIDVRPADEYAAGHLPGAWSVPLEQLHQAIARLPRDRTVVAYCRGPYCVLAVHAEEALRQAGFRAARLSVGPADFRRTGQPLETAPREEA